MKSWNGSVNGVVAATARSTCSSPSTSRRTVMPCLARSASSMVNLQRLVRVKSRVDKGVGRTEVAGRLERGIDLLGGDAGRRQPLLQRGYAQQHVAQREPGAHRPGTRLGYQVVRLSAAEHAGQQRR